MSLCDLCVALVGKIRDDGGILIHQYENPTLRDRLQFSMKIRI